MSKVTEESILNYLKTMKFKRSLFGVSRIDVLLKMRRLHRMYRQLLQEKTTADARRQVDRISRVRKKTVGGPGNALR